MPIVDLVDEVTERLLPAEAARSDGGRRAVPLRRQLAALAALLPLWDTLLDVAVLCSSPSFGWACALALVLWLALRCCSLHAALAPKLDLAALAPIYLPGLLLPAFSSVHRPAAEGSRPAEGGAQAAELREHLVARHAEYGRARAMHKYLLIAYTELELLIVALHLGPLLLFDATTHDLTFVQAPSEVSVVSRLDAASHREAYTPHTRDHVDRSTTCGTHFARQLYISQTPRRTPPTGHRHPWPTLPPTASLFQGFHGMPGLVRRSD